MYIFLIDRKGYSVAIFAAERFIYECDDGLGVDVGYFKIVHMPRNCTLLTVNICINNACIIGVGSEAKFFH